MNPTIKNKYYCSQWTCFNLAPCWESLVQPIGFIMAIFGLYYLILLPFLHIIPYCNDFCKENILITGDSFSSILFLRILWNSQTNILILFYPIITFHAECMYTFRKTPHCNALSPQICFSTGFVYNLNFRRQLAEWCILISHPIKWKEKINNQKIIVSIAVTSFKNILCVKSKW